MSGAYTVLPLEAEIAFPDVPQTRWLEKSDLWIRQVQRQTSVKREADDMSHDLE